VADAGVVNDRIETAVPVHAVGDRSRAGDRRQVAGDGAERTRRLSERLTAALLAPPVHEDLVLLVDEELRGPEPQAGGGSRDDDARHGHWASSTHDSVGTSAGAGSERR
jgi:hypothetical protein